MNSMSRSRMNECLIQVCLYFVVRKDLNLSVLVWYQRGEGVLAKRVHASSCIDEAGEKKLVKACLTAMSSSKEQAELLYKAIQAQVHVAAGAEWSLVTNGWLLLWPLQTNCCCCCLSLISH
jgi:hypothetical protein